MPARVSIPAPWDYEKDAHCRTGLAASELSESQSNLVRSGRIRAVAWEWFVG